MSCTQERFGICSLFLEKKNQPPLACLFGHPYLFNLSILRDAESKRYFKVLIPHYSVFVSVRQHLLLASKLPKSYYNWQEHSSFTVHNQFISTPQFASCSDAFCTLGRFSPSFLLPAIFTTDLETVWYLYLKQPNFQLWICAIFIVLLYN